MHRWVALAGLGAALCVVPLVARDWKRDAPLVAEELSKPKKQGGFTKNVTPHPLVGVDLSQIKLTDKEATAAAFGNRVAKLSLDINLQKGAETIMKHYAVPEAAVVMTEVSTGRVLAWASHLEKGPHRDLCVEATAPAASVFKIVTAAALVEQAGQNAQSSQCYWGGEHKLDASNLVDDPKRDKYCATLSDAMGRSLNTVFARMALKHLTPPKLISTAQSLGFGGPLPFDVPVAPNALVMPEDNLGFARTSAGFWNTTLSPFGGALLAATVANRGMIVKPYIVESVSDPSGVLYQTKGGVSLRRAIKPETAEQITTMMEATTTDGTCYKAFHDVARRPYLPNISIASKTGTLTREKTDQFYTWFVGFAPSRAPEIALSVVVVNSSTWTVKANTVAREMMQLYFSARGAPGVTPPKGVGLGPETVSKKNKKEPQ